MYYIDDLLYPEMLESIKQYNEPTTMPPFKSTSVPASGAERIPIGINESNDSRRDMHPQTDIRRDDSDSSHEDDDSDGEVVTPRALPVKYLMDRSEK